MKTKFLFLFLCFFSSCMFVSQVIAQVNQRDSLALVSVYHNLNDTFRHDLRWLKGPVSTWGGVVVTNNRVVELNLVRDIYHGTISDSIGNLDTLQYLMLSGNDSDLTGSIPASIGKLRNLRVLDLTFNALTGSLPYSIGNMDSLQVIQAPGNQLSGPIPSSFGKLQNLEFVDLSGNLISGSIPSSIGNLQKLTSLNLSSNSLISIPSTIKNATQLANLNISKNKIAGNLPAFVGSCTGLTTLNLSSNQFTGSIPASFKNLSALLILDLSGNQLSGQIGDVFPARLSEANLQYNQFSGTIPRSLRNCPRMAFLNMSYNQFSGRIPDALSKISPTATVDLSYNRLTGTIPSTLSGSQINLSHNGLTGTLPAGLSRELLQSFDVSFNKLSGDISGFLTPGLTYLYDLRINDNQLFCTTNPQWMSIPTSDGGGAAVLAQNNRFTFNGLEFVAEKLKLATGTNYNLDSQAVIPMHAFSGGLAVSAGGTLNNNTYTWYRVGSARAKVVRGDSTFKPTANGSYYATITNAVVSKVTLRTDTLVYKLTTTVSPAISNELQITFSPNPARNTIKISGLDDKDPWKISIADMSGYTWLSTASRQQSVISVNISQLKPGNYLINVKDAKGATKTMQFIKE